MKTVFTLKISSLLTCLLALVLTGSLNAQSVEITAPSSVAGTYIGTPATFGPAATSISGNIVLVDDGDDMGGTTSVSDACEALVNGADIAGNIALLDRGACGFSIKSFNAQEAGAIAAIICTNNPDNPIWMGGDDLGNTIPMLMLSMADCDLIKMGLADGLVGTVQGPLTGENCATAITVSEGVHTAPMLTGGSGVTYLNGALSTLWYAYTPATNGTVNVNSCGGGTDTRTVAWAGADCNSLGIAYFSDDDCEAAAADTTASDMSGFVFGGTTYYISWDDVHSADGFDWELSLADPDSVDVTVSVDMSFTADVAADGVFVAGSFSSFSPVAMTDNGDGTWTHTFRSLAGDQVTYKFQNGEGNWEDGDLLTDCGTGDFTDRFVTPTGNLTLGLVCYEACGSCVPTDCSAPIVLAADDFEAATVGDAADAAIENWEPWPGGTSSNISDAQGNGGAGNSVFVSGTSGAEDNIYYLGDRTSGHYRIGFSLFAEAGSGYYFNIQKTHTLNGNIGDNFGSQMTFAPGGAYDLDAGADNIKTGTWTEGEWNDFVILADLDNDWMTLYVENVFIYSWSLCWGTFDQDAGFNQLGGINFFPLDATYQFYVDDVTVDAIPPPADGEGQYCYNAIAMAPGTNTTPGTQECFGGMDQERAAGGVWYTWDAPEDGVLRVETCGNGADTRVWIMAGDCNNRTIVGSNDDRCDLGDGNAWASIRDVAVTAGTTYYVLWDNRWDVFGFDFEVGFTAGAAEAGKDCSSAVAITPGVYTIESIDGESAVIGPTTFAEQANYNPTNYAQSVWYSYTPAADGFMNLSSCDMSGMDTRVSVYEGTCGSYESLTRIALGEDECGTNSEVEVAVTAGTTYLIEWDDDAAGDDTGHDFELQLKELSAVTFTVETDLITVAFDGMFIAGAFNGWTGEAMTNNFDGSWSATYDIIQGDTAAYKFQNGDGGWENIIIGDVDCTLGGFGDRFVVGPTMDTSVDAVCFDYCIACDDIVDVDELDFVDGIRLFPNPAKDVVNVTYDFNESTDLNITIISSVGQVVSENSLKGAISGTEILDVSKLVPGLYFVQLSDGNNQSTKRVVIEQ